MLARSPLGVPFPNPRVKAGAGCRRVLRQGELAIHGLVPGIEYALELRLAYGSGASIGVGTSLKLSVQASGGERGHGSDGGHDGVGGGQAVLSERAFGAFQMRPPEGTLEAVLAGVLKCEWEWMEAAAL